jgi:hypothetical protein
VTYPELETVAELLNSLHASGVPDPSYPTVGQRVAAYLFDSSVKLYERHPKLTALIPPELYESGRWLAKRLAQQHDSPIVLPHGDLTPSNILDGGAERGLVAIDPAPCLGDAVFDAVDLILWEAHDLKTIEARTEWLAAATGADAERLRHRRTPSLSSIASRQNQHLADAAMEERREERLGPREAGPTFLTAWVRPRSSFGYQIGQRQRRQAHCAGVLRPHAQRCKSHCLVHRC